MLTAQAGAVFLVLLLFFPCQFFFPLHPGVIALRCYVLFCL